MLAVALDRNEMVRLARASDLRRGLADALDTPRRWSIIREYYEISRGRILDGEPLYRAYGRSA